MCGLYDDAEVASSRSVSDPTGARRLGHASIGLSVAGMVISVVVVIIVAYLVDTGSASCAYSHTGICSDGSKHLATMPKFWLQPKP